MPKSMISIIILMLTAVPLAWIHPAHASQESELFVNELIDEALTILKSSESAQRREQNFGELIDKRTNMRRIARFTLGAVGRTTSAEELDLFQATLRDMLVRIYANRLAGYSDERVDVISSTQKGRNHLVSSRIIFTNERPPVDMVWWVIEENDGSFSLFDIQILGVWMAQEQRDIFGGILKSNQGKIDALIAHLKEQINAATARDDKAQIAAN